MPQFEKHFSVQEANDLLPELRRLLGGIQAVRQSLVVEWERAQPVLRAVTENVLLEIQKTFDFFKATASSDPIDRIMLSGGASRVDGFKEMVQERFNAPVEEFDPFRAVTWDAKNLGGDAGEMASTAAVAVGLALRTMGDR